MTADERAYQIVCDVFGSESGWEHVTRMVADAIREAVAAERERCAHAVDCESTAALAGHTAWYYPHNDLRALAARIREGT